MTWRSLRVLFLPCVILLLGASYPSTNFVVEAPTPQIAEQVSKWAEHYRREKAILWLGREMPNWPTPCPLHVKVTQSGASGATSFNFSGGGVWQTMEIEGPLDRLIYSVLPHEVTHTVFAHYFGAPVPRWADEGGAVLSEDEIECSRHDTMVRQILNAGGALRLPRLFSLKDYPRDPRNIGALYAEGFSVSKFLVGLGNRQTFLSFVAHGMQPNYGWDNAARTYYRFQNVSELEQAWLADLRNTRKQPASAAPVILAKNEVGSRTDSAKTVVRLTAPPVQPLADDTQPIFRARRRITTAAGPILPVVPRREACGPDIFPKPNLFDSPWPSAAITGKPPPFTLAPRSFRLRPARLRLATRPQGRGTMRWDRRGIRIEEVSWFRMELRNVATGGAQRNPSRVSNTECCGRSPDRATASRRPGPFSR